MALLVSEPDLVCFASSGFTLAVSLPALGPLAPTHPTQRAGGARADVLRASWAVAIGYRSMKPSFSASHPDKAWGIAYIPALPAEWGQRHSFQDLAPNVILSSFWWPALLTPKSFSKSSFLINHFHMNSHLRVCFWGTGLSQKCFHLIPALRNWHSS